MKRTRSTSALAIAMLLGSTACGEDARPKASPAPVEPAHAAAPKPAAPAAETEATPDQLPLEDDFGAQAEQEITADNYRAALDAIEKEMKAEAPRK